MPECIPALREEIESVIATDGWTKAAIGKMWKLDSLFRESSRHNGIGLSSYYLVFSRPYRAQPDPVPF